MKSWNLEWMNDVVWLRSMTVWSFVSEEEVEEEKEGLVVVMVVEGEVSLGFLR